jgi:hypothetical protein
MLGQLPLTILGFELNIVAEHGGWEKIGILLLANRVGTTLHLMLISLILDGT